MTLRERQTIRKRKAYLQEMAAIKGFNISFIRYSYICITDVRGAVREIGDEMVNPFVEFSINCDINTPGDRYTVNARYEYGPMFFDQIKDNNRPVYRAISDMFYYAKCYMRCV